MTTLRTRAKLLPALAVVALAAAACGGSSNNTGTGTGSNAVEVKDGGTITYASEKNPTNFNTLSSDGNTFDTQLMVNPVFPATFDNQPDFSVKMNKDLLTSAELTSQEPETVTYKINPKAVWSDGTPISVDDFIYAWQTANGKDTGYSPASTAGYDQISTVTGSDNGKTVTVVFAKKYSDWKGLFGPLLPAHFMATLGEKHKAYNTGLTGEQVKKISGGPYIVSGYESNKQVVLSKNAKFWGTPAHLDTIVFRILTDASVEPQALANKEVQVMYPQPQVDLVSRVKAIQGVTAGVGFGPIFEHFDFNVANQFLKDVALRKALFTAIDRQQIVDATVKQFSDKAEVLNNRMLVKGQPGYQDNVTSENLGAGKIDDAKKILTDAGYKGVGTKLVTKDGKAVAPLRMRYTTGNKIRQQECELFQAAAAKLGVTISITTTDSLGGTLDGHDYDVVVFAWVGTPFPNSANGPLYITKGGSNYNSYSNPDVDAALKDAAVQLDAGKAQDDLNKADLQLSKDAVTLPLYQKPTFLAYVNTYGNIHDNATSVGPTYNIQQWGLKKSAT